MLAFRVGPDAQTSSTETRHRGAIRACPGLPDMWQLLHHALSSQVIRPDQAHVQAWPVSTAFAASSRFAAWPGLRFVAWLPSILTCRRPCFAVSHPAGVLKAIGEDPSKMTYAAFIPLRPNFGTVPSSPPVVRTSFLNMRQCNGATNRTRPAYWRLSGWIHAS